MPMLRQRSELNEVGLVIDILLRLPARTVIRFRCVCKAWFSLTTEPQFARAHTSRSQDPPAITAVLFMPTPQRYCYSLLGHRRALPNKPFPFLSTCHRCMIESSCNGLAIYHDRSSFKRYICNPTTGEYRELPTPINACGLCTYHLAYDPSVRFSYKVIAVEVVGTLTNFNIYSSETRTWSRSSLGSLRFSGKINFQKGAFRHGTVYWMSETNLFLLGFDVDREKITSVPLPKGIDGSAAHVHYFGATRGRLQLIVSDSAVEAWAPFDAWEMKPDGSGWKSLYLGINLQSILRNSAWEFRPIAIYCSVGEGSVTEDAILVACKGKTLSYLPRKCSLELICDDLPYRGEFFPYSPSLSPL